MNFNLLNDLDKKLISEAINEKVENLKADFYDCSSSMTDNEINEKIERYKSILEKIS